MVRSRRLPSRDASRLLGVRNTRGGTDGLQKLPTLWLHGSQRVRPGGYPVHVGRGGRLFRLRDS